MARKPAPKAGGARHQTEAATPRQDDFSQVIDALRQVTGVLTSAGATLQQFVQSSGPPAAAAAAVQINTWDDPFSETTPTTNPPLGTPRAVALAVNPNPRLRIAIVEPQLPAARYDPGSAGFRYWVTTEALARGINFWGALLPAGTTWSTSNPMRVILVDASADLNARYFRSNGLHFYQRRIANVDVRTAESPDVVAHELGHAVLDALRPQLFNAGDPEVSAFHEAFGDMSAILCGLQLPAMRQGIIAETNGRLNVNSRLSRLAEQLGWGIRQLSSTGVDRDCLRNAANRFFYRRIDQLPPSAPATLLSSAPHSFSRVFTGAFLDVLARMFGAAGAPHEAALLAVSRDLGQIIVDAVRAAPITTGYFSQVAAAMIQADQARFGGRNRQVLTGAFVERGILSINSAIAMADAPVPRAVSLQAEGRGGGGGTGVGGGMAAGTFPPDGSQAESFGSPILYAYEDEVADDGFRQGFGETPELPRQTVSIGGALTIDVHAPAEPPRFEVASAMVGSGPDGVLDTGTAMRLFVEGLIQRREVDLGEAMGTAAQPASRDAGKTTHSLVAEGRKMVLKRDHFACGFCQCGEAAAACF